MSINNFSFIDTKKEFQLAKQIMLDFSVCDVTIKVGKEFSLSGRNINTDKLEYNIAGDNLYFRYFEDNNVINQSIAKVEIILPDNYFDTITINSNVGKVQLNDTRCKLLTYYGGVGETRFNNLLVEEKANLSTNVGRLKSKDSCYNNLDIQTNVGAAVFDNCKITGNCNIDGGVGKITINLKGDFNDYSFKTKTKVGKAVINGQRYNNIITERKINHFNISTGVGSISLNINTD